MRIKIQLLAILVLTVFFLLPKIRSSGAYFSDDITVAGISITTGTWDTPTASSETASILSTSDTVVTTDSTETPTPTPEETISPTSTPSATPESTATPTASPTETPTPTPEETITPSPTPLNE